MTTKNTPKTRRTPKGPAPGVRKGRSAPAPKGGAEPRAGTERTDGLRAGTKLAMLLDLVSAPGGVTEAAACKRLGWQKCRVTIKRVVARAGRELATSKNAKGETVYALAPKKGAAA